MFGNEYLITTQHLTAFSIVTTDYQNHPDYGKIPDSKYYELAKPRSYYADIVGVYFIALILLVYVVVFIFLTITELGQYKNILF
mgnify:CR=1 FL=1